MQGADIRRHAMAARQRAEAVASRCGGLPGSPDYYKVGQTPEMQMSVGLNARRPLTEEEEDALEADQLKSTLHRGAGGAKMMSWNNDSPYTQNL